MLFVIGMTLLALGRYSDALISVGLGLINALISSGRRSERNISWTGSRCWRRHPCRAVRDQREVEVSRPTWSSAATCCGCGPASRSWWTARCGRVVEADESLLTGESCAVVKRPGDELRSGSLCVVGEGHMQVRDVGAASYAGRLTAEARRTTTDVTPLQRRIAFVVRLVVALTVLMSGAILAQAALEGFTLLRIVQTTAVLSGLVPYGLFFLIAVAYTAGAATIAGPGALVQQVNAVESVANVDVVAPTRPAR